MYQINMPSPQQAPQQTAIQAPPAYQKQYSVYPYQPPHLHTENLANWHLSAKKAARAVPESFKKKAARDDKLMKSRKANMEQAKKDRVAARKVALANAEKYFKEYQAADAKLIKDKRDAKAAGNFFVEGEAKVALVVRIRGINKLAPKPKKILQLLRLRQLHNAVFVKLNKATWNMLRMVEPFVTYGFPSRATI
jgi:large subunit ribosomal protein L7e